MARHEKTFVCSFPDCGKRFRTKFSLSRHDLLHSQEKNFICEFCNKKFALLQYLKEHRSTHTSEKPYVCGVSGCQERFSQTGKLSLHRRTHPEYKLKKYHSSSSYNKAITQKKGKRSIAKEVSSIVHKENIMTSSGEEQVNVGVVDGQGEKRVNIENKQADLYLWYLNNLHSPMSLIVRPILPQPKNTQQTFSNF